MNCLHCLSCLWGLLINFVLFHQGATSHRYLCVPPDGTLRLHGPYPQGSAQTFLILPWKYGLLSASFRTNSCHPSQIQNNFKSFIHPIRNSHSWSNAMWNKHVHQGLSSDCCWVPSRVSIPTLSCQTKNVKSQWGDCWSWYSPLWSFWILPF